MKRIQIELFLTPGCGSCAETAARLKAVLAEFDEERVSWRDVNLLDEIDYAVELGLVGPSAIAIDGELVFAKLPSAETLREEVMKRLTREDCQDGH